MPYVLRVSEPLEFDENEKPKLDPSDPRVRKLVYSMYRDMLSNRNHEANEFISQKDPTLVRQDLGVVPILESIIKQGGSGSGGTSPGTPPAPPPLPSTNGSMGIPPPPPPMAPPGSLPALRLNSEIGPLDKGPPKQIQGAMMKDKKPFTYTPGGIDLFSEIRSPRMAKRIQMNAAAEGVTSVPHPGPQGNGHGHASGTHSLTPAAIAAMQPQMPVAVFPQGGISQANLHRTHRPNDFTVPAGNQQPNYQVHQSSIPTPPPPPRPFNLSLEQEHRQGSAPRPTSPRPPPMSLASVMNQSVRAHAPEPDEETQVQSHLQTELYASPPQHQPKTKAQALSQQPGTIYIPPTRGDWSQPPQTNTNVLSMQKCPVSPNAKESDSDRDTATENINSKTSTPLTPQLNKAPTPWLNSQNRNTNQPSSPSTTKQSTPWGQSIAPRVIPIRRDACEEETENKVVGQQQHPQHHQVQNGRVITTQVKAPTTQDESRRQIAQPQHVSAPSGTRIIPIHIQGQTPQHEKNQFVTPPQQSTFKQPSMYSSPIGLFSGKQQGAINGSPSMMQRQDKPLHEGIDKMTISLDEGYRTIPIQSKSFKVLQKITDGDEKVAHQKIELKGDDKQLLDSVKAKVDESSLHGTTEPRFRGAHIPSKSFQALYSHLPPSPVTDKQEFQAYPAKSGPVTHTIQIQMPPQSPSQMYGGPRSWMHSDHGLGADGASPAGITTKPDSNTTNSPPVHSYSPSPLPRSEQEVNGHEVNERQVTPEVTENQVPSQGEQSASDWDAYWYYYWYWANYWQSLGYECPPPDWDSQCSTPVQTPVSIPSKKFKSLQRAYDDESDYSQNEMSEQSDTEPSISKLTERKSEPENGHRGSNGIEFLERNFPIHLRSIVEDDSECMEDSEAESNVGIVEEPPDSPSSDFRDNYVLDSSRSQPEECPYNVEEQCHRTDRLSTIDELSETDRGISSRSSFETADRTDESDYLSTKSEDEDTFGEDSSASVIELADADLTTTVMDDSSTTLSSSDDEDLEDAEVESTVTVRLPLRRSFTKSKSYRDIATVLVAVPDEPGDSILEEEGDNDSLDQNDLEDSRCSENGTEANGLENSAESNLENESEDIDFWGEIIGPNTEDAPIGRLKNNQLKSSTPFQDQNESELNFWDKLDSTGTNYSILENQFKFSREFVDKEENDFMDNVLEDEDDALCQNVQKCTAEVEKLQIVQDLDSDCTVALQPNQDLEVDNLKAFPGTLEDVDNETDWKIETNIASRNGFRLSDDSSAPTGNTGEVLSASDETSDESSSKSSTATVTLKTRNSKLTSLWNAPATSQSADFAENAKVNLSASENIQHSQNLSTVSKSSDEIENDQSEDSCTCHKGKRIGKTENLLWRIERFLQQSFTSLGSEEDSGVMTDQSRQMSDAETDNDEGSVQNQPIRAPPASTSAASEDSKASALDQQRRALCYERAKTHSRLFQLLQEECDREDEEEAAGLTHDRRDTVDSPSHKAYLSPAIQSDSGKSCIPGSDSGLSVGSSGSLSGSSGLLSPMNKEQILVDIINQFQTRHRKDSIGAERRQLSSSVFPSKIFKMLHDEFGEEFYDALDFYEGEFFQDSFLKNGASPTPEECTAHKNEHCQNKSESIAENITAIDTLSNPKRKKRKNLEK